jgi:hypothetical protein
MRHQDRCYANIRYACRIRSSIHPVEGFDAAGRPDWRWVKFVSFLEFNTSNLLSLLRIDYFSLYSMHSFN